MKCVLSNWLFVNFTENLSVFCFEKLFSNLLESFNSFLAENVIITGFKIKILSSKVDIFYVSEKSAKKPYGLFLLHSV